MASQNLYFRESQVNCLFEEGSQRLMVFGYKRDAVNATKLVLHVVKELKKNLVHLGSKHIPDFDGKVE